jgi:hypothetical protein
MYRPPLWWFTVVTGIGSVADETVRTFTRDHVLDYYACFLDITHRRSKQQSFNQPIGQLLGRVEQYRYDLDL